MHLPDVCKLGVPPSAPEKKEKLKQEEINSANDWETQRDGAGPAWEAAMPSGLLQCPCLCNADICVTHLCVCLGGGCPLVCLACSSAFLVFHSRSLSQQHVWIWPCQYNRKCQVPQHVLVLSFIVVVLIFLKQGLTVYFWLSWSSLCKPDCPEFTEVSLSLPSKC